MKEKLSCDLLEILLLSPFAHTLTHKQTKCVLINCEFNFLCAIKPCKGIGEIWLKQWDKLYRRIKTKEERTKCVSTRSSFIRTLGAAIDATY